MFEGELSIRGLDPGGPFRFEGDYTLVWVYHLGLGVEESFAVLFFWVSPGENEVEKGEEDGEHVLSEKKVEEFIFLSLSLGFIGFQFFHFYVSEEYAWEKDSSEESCCVDEAE